MWKTGIWGGGGREERERKKKVHPTLQDTLAIKDYLVGRTFVALLDMPLSILTTTFYTEPTCEMLLLEREMRQHKQLTLPAWEETPCSAWVPDASLNLGLHLSLF